MNSSVTVAADLGLRLVVPGHGEVPLTASLSYRGDDPYAIRMAFHVGTDEPVEWIFARDLLAAGLDHAAGEGDVRVWPGTRSHRDVLHLSLSSPFGQAEFEVPLVAMTGFLARTFEVVPAGHECDFIDIDGEVNELLRWALGHQRHRRQRRTQVSPPPNLD
ncbi:MAG TPA: SsgA family sporulation/cell division regulator [Streptosporangiaceae bacterium]|nr:SsgA family sporulation/cell division regulator [Streptosporangiaceae bacterium]